MKRILILFFLVLVCALAFSTGQKDEAPVQSGPVEIVYYMWDDPTYMQIVEAFNASQNEVAVKMQVVPAADYEVKLMTVLAGGVKIDAFMQKRQTDMFAQFANGYIEPLDELIKQTNYDIKGVSAYESATAISPTSIRNYLMRREKNTPPNM